MNTYRVISFWIEGNNSEPIILTTIILYASSLRGNLLYFKVLSIDY